MDLSGIDMSNIQAAVNRMQEIEARLGIYDTSSPTPSAPLAASRSSAAQQPFGTKQPFDVMVARAGGMASLRPLDGSGAGPFSSDIETLVTRYASQNGLDPELVRAVIQQESSGHPRSVSAVGAKGLMQLMPETAAAYGVTDPFDPEQNIAAGTRHLAGLLKEFNGDIPSALAAYNAGSAAVRKYNGVPPYAETQQYVRRIMSMLPQH